MDPAENFSKYKELQLVHLKVNTPIDDPSGLPLQDSFSGSS
jgi:hypothetical protein